VHFYSGQYTECLSETFADLFFSYSLPTLAEFAFANYALTHPRLQRHDSLKEIWSERKGNNSSTNICGRLRNRFVRMTWAQLQWHDQLNITILLFGADSHRKTNWRIYKPALLCNTGPALLTYSRGSCFGTRATSNSKLCVNTYFLHFFHRQFWQVEEQGRYNAISLCTC
jgi:hypothetical protein